MIGKTAMTPTQRNARLRALNPERCKAVRDAWRKKNAEKIKAQARAWAVKNKDHIYEITKRSRAKSSRYRDTSKKYRERTKDKRALYSHLKRAKNPDLYRGRYKNWAANNPGKARERNHRYRGRKRRDRESGKLVSEFMRRAINCNQLLCFYCSVPVSKGTLVFDHVVPLSRDGAHHPDNLVPCCQKCNSSKRDKFLSEWKRRPRVMLGFDGCPFGWSPEKEWRYKRFWGQIPWSQKMPA